LLITELLVKQEIDAANVVLVDNQGLLVLPVTMVALVKPVLLVPPVNLEKHLLNHVPNKLHHHANHVLLDHLAHLAHPVLPVMLDQMDNLVQMADLLLLENLDHQDLLDLPALMDNPELPETQELMPSQKAFNLAHLDLLVMLDHPDLLDLLDNLAMMVHPDNLDQKDHPAQLEILALMVNLVLPDKLVPLVELEKKVSAPNIAPSTVVSSSKTELADKQISLFTLLWRRLRRFFSFNCNVHCHCCHALWLCKPLDRIQLNYFFVILLYAKFLDKNKKLTY
jgi:hypothetical protein